MQTSVSDVFSLLSLYNHWEEKPFQGNLLILKICLRYLRNAYISPMITKEA